LNQLLSNTVLAIVAAAKRRDRVLNFDIAGLQLRNISRPRER
jgi:hypothetical protein